MTGPPIIEVENLSFGYQDTPALSGVNLVLNERDFVTVIGPNGGGKTTLLKLMLGLLEAQQGRISIFGTSPREARPRIGYMPQHAHLDPKFPVSVLEVVLMGRLGAKKMLGPYAKKDREIAERVLAEVGLMEKRNRPLSELSGGQKQRALIARALASEPELLLLDEPTSSLDLLVEGNFFELLRKLNERLTILLVSHDIAFVSQFVNTVVCVNRKVLVHHTHEITNAMIRDTYGCDIRLVHHHHHGHGGAP